MTSEYREACPAKRRGRPKGPTQDTIAFREALRPIVEEQEPCTIRQAFYQCVWRGLVDKSETGYDKVQRNLLAMRRDGMVSYDWICDLYRETRGYDSWGGPEEFIDDVAAMYRRDYWRRSPVRVEFWCEKSTLCGFLDPIICDQWGLSYWAGGGFTSETALYKGGTAIAARRKHTYVYILSDFDPSGEDIAHHIAHGTKRCPGGIERFTRGVPVAIRKLAVTKEQVRQWVLPTRPVNSAGKKLTTRKQRFIEEHGDAAVELDAIEPRVLRALIDSTIEKHCDPREIAALKETEQDERELFTRWLALGREAAS
jgi:hypothetical protein